MDDTTTPGDTDADAQPDRGRARRPRWLGFAGVAVAVAFTASVVLSAGSASVPVGVSGAMSSMSMGTSRLALTMWDVDDRTVRVPDGRPGIVVFASATNCGSCVSGTRLARDVIQRVAPQAQLVVVMVDSATGRGDITAFARSVGPSPARYVLDDRNGRLVSMLSASALGGAVVYDALGRIVARLDAGAPQLLAALRGAQR